MIWHHNLLYLMEIGCVNLLYSIMAVINWYLCGIFWYFLTSRQAEIGDAAPWHLTTFRCIFRRFSPLNVTKIENFLQLSLFSVLYEYNYIDVCTVSNWQRKRRDSRPMTCMIELHVYLSISWNQIFVSASELFFSLIEPYFTLKW